MSREFRQPPITHFIVEEHKHLQTKNNSNGVVFPVRDITVGRSRREGTLSYYQLSDLSNTGPLTISIGNVAGIEDAGLPQDMLIRMAQYIRQKHIIPMMGRPFDCLSFAHYANGIRYQYPIFDPERWIISKLDSADVLKAGDTIFLSESTNPENYRVTHFAIYIGHALFISKFGSSGPLIATGLPEMQQCFGGEHIFQSQPAHPSPDID